MNILLKNIYIVTFVFLCFVARNGYCLSPVVGIDSGAFLLKYSRVGAELQQAGAPVAGFDRQKGLAGGGIVPGARRRRPIFSLLFWGELRRNIDCILVLPHGLEIRRGEDDERINLGTANRYVRRYDEMGMTEFVPRYRVQGGRYEPMGDRREYWLVLDDVKIDNQYGQTFSDKEDRQIIGDIDQWYIARFRQSLGSRMESRVPKGMKDIVEELFRVDEVSKDVIFYLDFEVRKNFRKQDKDDDDDKDCGAAAVDNGQSPWRLRKRQFAVFFDVIEYNDAAHRSQMANKVLLFLKHASKNEIKNMCENFDEDLTHLELKGLKRNREEVKNSFILELLTKVLEDDNKEIFIDTLDATKALLHQLQGTPIGDIFNDKTIEALISA